MTETPVIGLRFHMFDVVYRSGHRALGDGDNAFLHLVRGQSGISPDNGDNRNVDIRKNVFRRNDGRDRAENQDQNGEYDKSIRPAESEMDYPHARGLFQQLITDLEADLLQDSASYALNFRLAVFGSRDIRAVAVRFCRRI